MHRYRAKSADFCPFSPAIGTFSDMKVWQKSAKMRNFSSIWRTFALI